MILNSPVHVREGGSVCENKLLDFLRSTQFSYAWGMEYIVRGERFIYYVQIPLIPELLIVGAFDQSLVRL